MFKTKLVASNVNKKKLKSFFKVIKKTLVHKHVALCNVRFALTQKKVLAFVQSLLWLLHQAFFIMIQGQSRL